MSEHPIYKLTSIGRPVEPRYPTNKAVIFLLPLAAILAVLFSYFVSGSHAVAEVARFALLAMLTAFAGWALARELAPDDNPAAFISMAVVFLVYLLTSGGSILLLFLALALTRILNRSTGLNPRISDSVVVTLLAGWTAYTLETPYIMIIAAAAFLLDTLLPGAEKRQWPFVLVSTAIAAYVATIHGYAFTLPAIPSDPVDLMAPLVLLAFILSVFSVKAVNSPGDIDGKPLSAVRVKSGMLIVLLLAVAVIASGPGLTMSVVLLIAVMAGVPAGNVIHNLRNMKNQ
jgi:hypothetical protein